MAETNATRIRPRRPSAASLAAARDRALTAAAFLAVAACAMGLPPFR